MTADIVAHILIGAVLLLPLLWLSGGLQMHAQGTDEPATSSAGLR